VTEASPPPPQQGPRSLVSDADRERLLVLLREHYARGQLDLDEMSRRVGSVLASTYSDEAAAAVTDLPLLGGVAPAEPPAGQARRPRIGQRRRHAQRAEPGAGWVPTAERFRDPSTRAIMRVWVDPADLSRHYVPEPGS
jgi:Domain of unknown function (DUF1707)